MKKTANTEVKSKSKPARPKGGAAQALAASPAKKYPVFNMYWTDEHAKAARAVYERMKKEGIPADRGGEMNRGAVILYALQQLSRQPAKAPAAPESDES